MSFDHSLNAVIDFSSSFDSSDISIIWNLEEELNVFSNIYLTLRGIKIHFINDSVNACISIICKFELVGKLILPKIENYLILKIQLTVELFDVKNSF